MRRLGFSNKKSSLTSTEPKFGSPEWYDYHWNRVHPKTRLIAAEIIQRNILSEDDFALIRRKYAEYGSHEWIHHALDTTEEERAQMDALLPAGAPEEARWPKTMSAHHIWGTAVRNGLRKSGITDDLLPLVPYENGEEYRNWDDFYVSAIEQAAGLR